MLQPITNDLFSINHFKIRNKKFISEQQQQQHSPEGSDLFGKGPFVMVERSLTDCTCQRL